MSEGWVQTSNMEFHYHGRRMDNTNCFCTTWVRWNIRIANDSVNYRTIPVLFVHIIFEDSFMLNLWPDLNRCLAMEEAGYLPSASIGSVEFICFPHHVETQRIPGQIHQRSYKTKRHQTKHMLGSKVSIVLITTIHRVNYIWYYYK